MAETLWKWRLFLFASTVANTQTNRDSIANIFVNEGSNELLVNEKRAFEGAARLARTSAPSIIVAKGFSTPVKKSMRTSLEQTIEAINGGLSNQNKLRWYVIAAIDLLNFDKGELIASTERSVDVLVGKQFTWKNALDDLNLVVIED